LKEIVGVSGKGGVGKTRLTASLIFLLSRSGFKVVGADADVDAPNLALILRGEKIESKPIRASEKAFINSDKCDGCGICVERCKFMALNIESGKAVVNHFLCEGCGVCKLVCPKNAVEIKDVESGVVATIRTRYGFPLISGRLHIGETGSGKIVNAVKALARKLAEEEKSDFIFVDGPPGVGCPVISAIAGANYAIAVAEPTPTALYDLDRVLWITKHFKCPSVIVINKADMDREMRNKIVEYAEYNNVEVLGEIPLDMTVPYSVVNAMPIVEYAPESEASKSIKAVYAKILKILDSL